MLTQSEIAEIKQRNEVATILVEFAKTLLPARLYTEGEKGNRNGSILAMELQKENLSLTVDNLKQVTNEVLFESSKLEWVPGFEPAKLKARAQHEAKMNQTAAKHDADAFTQKLRNSELADAQAKADAASIKECRGLIAAYAPTRTTPRGEVINFAKQAVEHARLTKALDTAIAQKVNLQNFTRAVVVEIQRLYSLEEASRERM